MTAGLVILALAVLAAAVYAGWRFGKTSDEQDRAIEAADIAHELDDIRGEILGEDTTLEEDAARWEEDHS